MSQRLLYNTSPSTIPSQVIHKSSANTFLPSLPPSPVEQAQSPRLSPAASIRRGQLVQPQTSASGRATAAAAAPLVPKPLSHTPNHVLERLAVARGGLVVEESVLGRLVTFIVGEGVNNAFQVLWRKEWDEEGERREQGRERG